MSKVSSYKKVSWATIVNINENSTLEDFMQWCFKHKYFDTTTGKPTKYGCLRLLLEFAVQVLYNDNLADFLDVLCHKGYIKQGDLIEGINIMLLYAMERMPEDL